MNLQIRRAQAEDVKALWPLCREFGLFLTGGREATEPTTADRERVLAVLADQNQLVVLAEATGVLVGYALAQDHGTPLRSDWSVVRLHDLFVRPEHRRQGVASALHHEIVSWCALRPVRFLEWQASTEAIDFYVGLGYHPDHEGDFAEHPNFEHEFTARSVLESIRPPLVACR